MLSRNELKLIRSLAQKKVRDTEGLFLAEGPKLVDELLGAFACRLHLGTEDYLAARPPGKGDIRPVTLQELERASLLRTPQQTLAVFEKPAPEAPAATLPQHGLCLALDGVQDPGNVGTILRLADWFGIRHVVCSPDTADAFAPKVVQATMGALARVHIYTVPLPDYLGRLEPTTPVYGTFLDGESLYAQPLTPHGLIVMGNEGRGISAGTAQHVNRRLFIPSFPPGQPTGESLNVAIATAVTCAEFRRRQGLPLT